MNKRAWRVVADITALIYCGVGVGYATVFGGQVPGLEKLIVIVFPVLLLLSYSLGRTYNKESRYD